MADERIELHDLPARMCLLSAEMVVVGAAISYYGGWGPFAEFGNLMQDTSAPLLRELATVMERMQGGRA